MYVRFTSYARRTSFTSSIPCMSPSLSLLFTSFSNLLLFVVYCGKDKWVSSSGAPSPPPRFSSHREQQPKVPKDSFCRSHYNVSANDVSPNESFWMMRPLDDARWTIRPLDTWTASNLPGFRPQQSRPTFSNITLTFSFPPARDGSYGEASSREFRPGHIGRRRIDIVLFCIVCRAATLLVADEKLHGKWDFKHTYNFLKSSKK